VTVRTDTALHRRNDRDALVLRTLRVIRGSLGEGVSFTCSEYATIRECAVEFAPNMVDDLDERHAWTDDDEGDCMYARHLELTNGT
jgi:hypothetical protein